MQMPLVVAQVHPQSRRRTLECAYNRGGGPLQAKDFEPEPVAGLSVRKQAQAQRQRQVLILRATMTGMLKGCTTPDSSRLWQLHSEMAW